MASIGPQLPPHLQKRKRDDEDEDSASPPTKISRPDNTDEIPLDDDYSNDDFGPSAPNSKPSHTPSSIGPSAPPSRPSIGPSRPDQDVEECVAKATTTPPNIGPSLPPAAATTTNSDEIPLDDSDGDDIGPAAPAPPTIGPTPPPAASAAAAAAAAPKRIYGPAPPPADLSKRPTTDPNSDSDSDSDSDLDDGYGPALPGSKPAVASNNGPSLPTFQQQQRTYEEPQTPKRDDWMIAPPTDSSYRAPDPTKLKSRKFASGRSANTEKSGGISSIWTETPEEKIKRLAAAVLGREDPSSSSSSAPPPASSVTNSRTKDYDAERVRSYTEQTRGRSLVEEHQAAIAAGKKKLTSSNLTGRPGRAGDQYGTKAGEKVDDEDDPSKRVFDREKDMAIGGRISHTQRRDLLNKAANFGDRFQSGKFL